MVASSFERRVSAWLTLAAIGRASPAIERAAWRLRVNQAWVEWVKAGRPPLVEGVRLYVVH